MRIYPISRHPDLFKDEIIDDKHPCPNCKGKRREPTDMWNKETMAMWEPCFICDHEGSKKFYEATEKERINWYADV